MPSPKLRREDEALQAEAEAAEEAALEAERAAQIVAGARIDRALANGDSAPGQPATGLRVGPAAEPYKRYDRQPFSPEAERELERVVAAFRAEVVKKAARAKAEERGDVVSAHNVRTAAAAPRRSLPLAVKLAGTGGGLALGSVFGSLAPLLISPPPTGLPPLAIAVYFVLGAVGTVGLFWQFVREG